MGSVKNSNEVLSQSEARRYQRYAADYSADTSVQVEVIVEGEFVRVVNFSIGGLYVLAKTPFASGATVTFSANFANRGKIDLTGTVVRAKKEGDEWGIAIDLTKRYKLDTLCKV
jgi:hypothetical protein